MFIFLRVFALFILLTNAFVPTPLAPEPKHDFEFLSLSGHESDLDGSLSSEPSILKKQGMLPPLLSKIEQRYVAPRSVEYEQKRKTLYNLMTIKQRSPIPSQSPSC